MTGPRLPAAVAAAVLALAAPCGAGAADTPTLPTLPTPYGTVSLLLPSGVADGPSPSVLILPDRTGPDGREVAYADYLLAAGIAVLQFVSDEPGEAVPLLTPSALRAMVHRFAPARLDFSRIGLLGFGAGGRTALAAPEGPVAALYPACHGLHLPQRRHPTLLLHPDEPGEAEACRRLDPGAEVIRATTHGWDHGQGRWVGGTARLLHPDGSASRLLARSDGWATQESVTRVVRHFRDAFGGAEAAVPSRSPFHGPTPAKSDTADDAG